MVTMSKKKGYYVFVLTINNPTVSDFRAVSALRDETSYAIHGVFGREHFTLKAKQEGKTAHLQACIAFGVPTSWLDVKRLFPRAHIETKMRTNYATIVAYCKKENDYFEFGDELFAHWLLEREAKGLTRDETCGTVELGSRDLHDDDSPDFNDEGEGDQGEEVSITSSDPESSSCSCCGLPLPDYPKYWD